MEPLGGGPGRPARGHRPPSKPPVSQTSARRPRNGHGREDALFSNGRVRGHPAHVAVLRTGWPVRVSREAMPQLPVRAPASSSHPFDAIALSLARRSRSRSRWKPVLCPEQFRIGP
ncbi:hypothetical protein CDD83_43 [Cordyceps sp. RAO-2017]|nr:hypothetical protein CDD83_43 [Cordyceps sp. RAO-2017]